MKKILALGRQEFCTVIGDNCIYVDKTEDIHRLITTGKYYFLSRPRRFGKSLLANTLKEIFLGNKALFKGLWIYDKWDWKKSHPVIKMSFSQIGYHKQGLDVAIDNELNKIAESYNIKIKGTDNSQKFRSLIENLSLEVPVAIIIDEYDKPIIDYLDEVAKSKPDEITTADTNREILKNFYSVIKDLDVQIKFFFVTGVSKFSKVSLFSDLNNLVDITIDKNFSSIVGWTKDEIESNFDDYLNDLKSEYKDVFPDIMEEIRRWYNGYSWDGVTKLYNPVSIMNLLGKRFFSNYWFETGTPTFLMRLAKKQKITALSLKEDMFTSGDILNKYDFRSLNFISLLFQTGYLTITKIDIRTGRMTLNYPNREVAESFSKHLLSEFSYEYLDRTQSLIYKIVDSFTENNLDKLIKNINVLFRKIPYEIIVEKEAYFHSLFYLIIKLLGYQIEAEILTIDGRIDAVIKTDDIIYIIEFKINQSAQKAIQQIKDKKYADKYADDKRTKTLLGINFDTEKKCIEDYLVVD